MSLFTKIQRTLSTIDHSFPREKERKLQFVILKLIKWRDLFKKYIGDDPMNGKHSLEMAAALVGLSKKSLDDYLQQLKLGAKNEYDFNNPNANIGDLRYLNICKEKKDKK